MAGMLAIYKSKPLDLALAMLMSNIGRRTVPTGETIYLLQNDSAKKRTMKESTFYSSIPGIG